MGATSVLCMGGKRRALQASPPSDAAQCWDGKHRHASYMAMPRMRRSPTAFSEIQPQEQVEILLIAWQRLAQRAFELRVALAAELRAELRDRRLVRGDLAHDEVGSGTRLTRGAQRRCALRIVGRQAPALSFGQRFETLISGFVLLADPFCRIDQVGITKNALRAARINDSLACALYREQNE